MPTTTYRIETWQADSSFKFHEICRFENHVTRNDVIMTSLPKRMENADLLKTKQIIYRSKGIDESYPKMYFFLKFEPLCQKLWAFMSNFGIFYDARSPNMAISRDPRSKFRKNSIFS